jgi:hypothetical protein
MINNWIKVAKTVYQQIEVGGEVCHHGFTVNGEHVGSMEVVDQDEDRFWFDYYVRADFYRSWRESALVLA